MPFKRPRVINVTEDNKRRLVALRGSHFGTTENDVLATLLTIAENLNGCLRLDLDIQREIPSASRDVTGE